MCLVRLPPFQRVLGRPQSLHPHLPPLNLKKYWLYSKNPPKLQSSSKQFLILHVPVIYSIQELESFLASILRWVIGNNWTELTSIDLLALARVFLAIQTHDLLYPQSTSYTHFCLMDRDFGLDYEGMLRVRDGDVLFAEVSTVPDVPPKVESYAEGRINLVWLDLFEKKLIFSPPF